jgi:ketosteroid isomerase-like protein
VAEHPDVTRVKQGYEAFNAADVDALAELIAEDAVQHMVDDGTPVGGDHVGRDAIFAMYGTLGEVSNGTFRAIPEVMTTDGEGIVVVVHRSVGDRGDAHLDTREGLIFKFRDGTVVELHDTAESLDAVPAWFADGEPPAPRGEHPDVAVVRRGYDAFNAGDFAVLEEVMDERVTHFVPGAGPLSGPHEGRDAVFALYGKLAELSSFTFKVMPEGFFTDGKGTVVVLHHGTAERNGASLDNYGLLILEVVGGRAVSLHETTNDPEANDAFWS